MRQYAGLTPLKNISSKGNAEALLGKKTACECLSKVTRSGSVRRWLHPQGMFCRILWE
jgi:hypothetical protein